MILSTYLIDRNLIGIEVFTDLKPKYHTFYNTKIFHDEPIISFNFSKDEWILHLEYTNQKTRGGFCKLHHSLIFLNDIDISNQEWDTFNPENYKKYIINDNFIKIVCLQNWEYISNVWIFPKNWTDNKRDTFISEELKLWE